MNEGEQLERLPGERKVVYISAILGILVFIFLVVKKKATPGVSESQAQDPGAGLSAPYDPGAALEAQKAVSLASIEHSAALQFSIAQNSLSHDLGLHSSSGGGSGGLSIGPFSIGGSGHKEGADQLELTTQNDLTGGFSGSGLSQDEFELLVQEGQALVNAGAASQAATNAAGLDKLGRYKSAPGPSNAPRGMHLEQGANGSYYWVKDGHSILGVHA